jgi:hypothetical protein
VSVPTQNKTAAETLVSTAAISVTKRYFGRGERIRTSGLLDPNQALYQAEPRPEELAATPQGPVFRASGNVEPTANLKTSLPSFGKYVEDKKYLALADEC